MTFRMQTGFLTELRTQHVWPHLEGTQNVSSEGGRGGGSDRGMGGRVAASRRGSMDVGSAGARRVEARGRGGACGQACLAEVAAVACRHATACAPWGLVLS